jgi:hypothetical protein
MGLVANRRSQEPSSAADKLLMRCPVTKLRSVNPNAANKSMLCLAARFDNGW